MSEFPISPEYVKVTASAIVGGIAFKVIEKFLNGREFVEEHTQLRQELRTELEAVRKDVTQLNEEVAKWRDLYYEQRSVNAKLEAEMLSLRNLVEEYKRHERDLDNISIIEPTSHD